jgi:hypothetical protein
MPRILRTTSLLSLPLVVGLAIGGCGSPDPGSAPAGGWQLVEGGWLMDVEAGERVPNPGVLIGPDGRIRAVGESGDAAEGATAEVIRLGDDDTLLPGLIDLHAHYNMDLTGDGRVEETRWNPLVYLANGVTTTFPAGEYLPSRCSFWTGSTPGRGQAPGFLPSGPYFGSPGPGGTGTSPARNSTPRWTTWWERGVRHFKAKGAGPDHVRWLVERVHALGGTVTGHVDSGARGSTNSVEAIEAGIDRIEHILGGTCWTGSRRPTPSGTGWTRRRRSFGARWRSSSSGGLPEPHHHGAGLLHRARGGLRRLGRRAGLLHPVRAGTGGGAGAAAE